MSSPIPPPPRAASLSGLFTTLISCVMVEAATGRSCSRHRERALTDKMHGEI